MLSFCLFCEQPKLNRTNQSLLNARKQNPFLMMAFQAKCGNSLSIMAYETYSDILANKKKPRHLYNSNVVQKLLSLGLCSLNNGKLQLQSFYMNDEVLAFRKKK